MMIGGLAVIAGTYLATRLIHYYVGGHARKNAWIKELKEPLQPMSSVERRAHAIERETDSYLKASAVSAGLGVIAMAAASPALTLINFGVLGYSATPIIKQAEQSLLLDKKLRNDLLNALALALSVLAGQFVPAAIFVLIYHLGSKLEAKTLDYSEKMLINVFEKRPDRVWILRDGVDLEIPLESLDIEDTVIVSTGEVIPVDGTIIDGVAQIDQHALTGEALPLEKSEGDSVFASTVVVGGRISLKIDKTGSDTLVAELGEVLQNTADYKTQLQLRGETWANQAAAPLLITSVALLPFVNLSSLAAFISSSPGNVLRIVTSLHTQNHLTLASNNGILIKDGRALEELSRVDTIIFDKTGTLTENQPEVAHIICCDTYEERDILRYAAMAEHRINHPFATAILNKANEFSLPLVAHRGFPISGWLWHYRPPRG